MIDAHCHLQLLGAKVPIDIILSRARSAGISAIVTCACSYVDWTSPPILADEQSPKILHQFGIHPWWAKEDRPADWIDRLRKLLIENPSSGVGEIGIDKNKKSTIPFDIQIETFSAQLKLARELNRTATVHCVNAYGLLVDLLKEEFGSSADAPPIVIHSFSGSGETVDQLVRLFGDIIFFSVSGQCPRESVIPFIPLDNMLIETDSPDQPLQSVSPQTGVPTPIDAKTNDPSQLWHVANRVAVATAKDVGEVIQLTKQNAQRAYRIEH